MKTIKVFALMIGIIVLIGGIMITAASLFLAPPNNNWIAFIGAGVAACFLGMTLNMGFAVRMGIARFKPAKWVRRLFRIPDDYQPPAQ